MTKQSTILFFTPRFYPQLGGVETHVLSVSRELVRRGYKVIIVSESLEEELSSKWQTRYISDKAVDIGYLIDKSIKTNTDKYGKTENNKKLTNPNLPSETEKIIVYRLPEVKKNRLKKFIIWKWLLKNRKIIHESNLVHCHDVFYWYLPFRFLYFRKPVFTTFHGYEKYPIPYKNILIRKVSERLSWGNICVGAFIKKWYGTNPDFVTYGGVDLKIKSQKIKVKNTSKKLKILFLGRLEDENGVEIYASALDQLIKNKIKFEFEACGDGSMRNIFERYGRVHGWVENVTEYLAKADLVFASSYLSILQAMSAKKPIIAAYDNLLKRDYLINTPFCKWINIMNDKNDMFNKIGQVINDQNDKKIKEAYDWVRFQTWENLADLYIKLWSIRNL